MVFKSFNKLGSHLDVGDHITKKTKENRTIYDNLRLGWAAKFPLVDIFSQDSSACAELACHPYGKQA